MTELGVPLVDFASVDFKGILERLVCLVIAAPFEVRTERNFPLTGSPLSGVPSAGVPSTTDSSKCPVRSASSSGTSNETERSVLGVGDVASGVVVVSSSLEVGDEASGGRHLGLS